MSGGFTTRAGGVSAPPWDELNLAFHVEDTPSNVSANRDRLGRAFGGRSVSFVNQVHGAAVTVLDGSNTGRQVVTGDKRGSDGLVTAVPATPIGILVADCLPVLFADPAHRVVAAAHAGRVGLAAGVLPATVAAMVAAGATQSATTAVVGPGVCGRCYEVPAEMREAVDRQVPGTAALTRVGTPSLDLAAGAIAQLVALGIGVVRRTDICTMEDDRFYSHRRDGVTGRFAGVVMLDPDE